ncbi:MAG: flavin reductase [Gammaproteobacteria bacterium]|jgi:flavin reductase
MPETNTLDQNAYRSGMSRLAAAVNIVTSVGDDGPCGFTASAVCSVTDSPPTLLVCINRAAQSYPTICSSKVLCVNTVGPSHEDLALRFSGSTKDMAERFAGAAWSTAETGSPLLDGALVSFDCRITSAANVGTHDVLYCEVVAVREGDNHPSLVYWARKFLALDPLED